MAVADLAQIKAWFSRRKYPTEEQFSDTWDSFFHKDEKIPSSAMDGLDEAIDGKYEAEAGNALAKRVTANEEAIKQYQEQSAALNVNGMSPDEEGSILLTGEDILLSPVPDDGDDDDKDKVGDDDEVKEVPETITAAVQGLKQSIEDVSAALGGRITTAEGSITDLQAEIGDISAALDSIIGE